MLDREGGLLRIYFFQFFNRTALFYLDALPDRKDDFLRSFLKDTDWRSFGTLAAVALALTLAYILYPRPKQLAQKSGVSEVVYWIPSGLAESAISDSIKASLAEFERRNPQYRVVLGSATTRDEVGDPTRFLLGVAGGVPPDLIYFDRFAVVEWASRGAFTDLTSFLERDRGRPDGIRAENFFQMAWNEPIYKGRNYAIAESMNTRALFYNRDCLTRAGCVYQAADPDVAAGKALPGEARPPKTWEEVNRKLIHASARVTSVGEVTLGDFVRRPAVNETLPPGARPDLVAGGVRPGDVAALVAGNKVFRARVRKVLGPDRFQLDLAREQRPGLKSVPSVFSKGKCEVKISSQDGYLHKLTRFNPETGQISALGFIPLSYGTANVGDSWLYLWGWLNGAEFMNPEGTDCTLDSPPVVQALQWLSDCYDSVGGIESVMLYHSSAVSGLGLDPFLTNDVALRMDGDGFMMDIIAWKPDLNFGVAPPPIPEKRLQAGFKPVSFAGGYCHAIPATAKNKEGAWALLRWLASPEAFKIKTNLEASFRRAKGQIYFPSTHPDKRIQEWLQKKYIIENPSIRSTFVAAYNTYVKLLPVSRYRPVTPVGQKLWSEHVRATEAAINHSKLPYEALNYGRRQVQTALDGVMHPPTGPLVRWDYIIAFYITVILLVAGSLVAIQERKRRLYGGGRHSWLEGFICAAPWLVGLICFGAGPIIFSIIISFSHYDVLNPAHFIGLSNYVNLLGRHRDPVIHQVVWNDPIFWKSLANTGFMVVSVPLGIVCGLALALLLDSKVRGLHLYRTIYYLPAIVPAVASFFLWFWIFDPGRGLLNQMLNSLGFANPPHWLKDPLWSKPSLILMGLWSVGGSMIIWLAGLKDISESLYEAASIDGAGRFQRFRYITIPMLSPYIFFNLIMGFIGVFQIFESAFIMTDGGPADSTLFYAYKLFNEGFRFLNMGTASAMAWILFMVVLAITLLQLWLSKKWVHYGAS